VGVLIRLISLKTKGMEDVDVMINWGLSILNLGWDKGYLAIYFPTSHLIFNFIVELSTYLSIEIFQLFATIRLISDILFLFLLIILNKLGFISRLIVVLIWLNPLLLVLTLSGYTDTFSLTLILLSLVFLVLYQKRKKYYFVILCGFSLALFLFLKPQTLLLLIFLFFFIFVFVITQKGYENFIEKIFFLSSLMLPSLILFGLYSVILSSPTKLSCGDAVGPRTISSLEQIGQTEWNVCIDPLQISMTYPKSGPTVCIENKLKAYSPLGEAGFCVKNYEFSQPLTVSDYWQTGYKKLMGQILNGSVEHMPSYSANMPNFWHIYVVNFLNYDQEREVWSYKASENFNKNVWYSILLFVFAYSSFLLWIFRKRIKTPFDLISLIGFPVTFIIPIFSTLAHENHLALGIFFSYLLINLRVFDSRFTKLLHFLMIIISSFLALNISRLYLWPMWGESNSKLLSVMGNNFLDFFLYPNIYQIALLTTIAATIILLVVPLGNYVYNFFATKKTYKHNYKS
jgi:hypothetical protein